MLHGINQTCSKDNSHSTTKTIRREVWLDGLRALAMLFVIIGHQVKGHPNFHLFISPIKLPLFFSISGYLLYGKTNDLKASISWLIRRLLIPWFVAIIAEVIIQIPFRGLAFVPGEIYSYIVDTELWYLPCLFISEILFLVTIKCSKSVYIMLVIALAECILGLCLAKEAIANAMRFNTACITQLFICIGYLLRHFKNRLFSMKRGAISILIITYIILGLVSMKLWPGKNIDVNHNNYVCLPYSLVMICIGCTAAFLVANRIKRIPGFLCFIGQNTMLYYMSHNFVIAGIKKISRIAGINLPFVLSVALTTILTCIICGIFAVIINRFFPVLAGKRVKIKKST